MSEENRTFVVDRAKWARGTGNGLLRDSHGNMCCLGFCLLQMGLQEERIEGRPMPSDVAEAISPFSIEVDLDDDVAIPGVSLNDTDLTERAASINDDDGIDDKERERRLTKLFEEYGHTITFTGEGRPA